MKNIFYSPFIAAALLFASCSSTPKTEAPQKEAHGEHGHEEEEGTVALNEQQAKAINLKTGTLIKKHLGTGIKTTGELGVPPQNIANVSAIIGGNVSQIFIIEGNKVFKGQKLAEMSHPDLIQIQTDYQEVLAQISFAKNDFDRQKELSAQNATSLKKLQIAEATYKRLEAKANGLKMKLQLLNINPEEVAKGNTYQTTPILSPIEGVIQKVEVATGMYVTPNKELFEIIDPDHIHAEIKVFEKDAHLVKEGQKVEVWLNNMPQQRFPAYVKSISAIFEESPRAIHVHAEIEDLDPRLIPGAYIQAKIHTSDSLMLTLPEDALVQEDGKEYIFVVVKEKEPKKNDHGHNHGKKETAHKHGENETSKHNEETSEYKFKMIEVISGRRDADYVEIKFLEKMDKNTKFVYVGAYYILSEMKKAEAEHTH